MDSDDDATDHGGDGLVHLPVPHAPRGVQHKHHVLGDGGQVLRGSEVDKVTLEQLGLACTSSGHLMILFV